MKWPKVWILHSVETNRRGARAVADLIAAYQFEPNAAQLTEALHNCYGGVQGMWDPCALDLISKYSHHGPEVSLYLHEIGVRPIGKHALTLEYARAIARGRWGRVTAYRVGRVYGERACVYRNPYKDGSNAAASFNQGIAESLGKIK